jgi:type II secretion system protein N
MTLKRILFFLIYFAAAVAVFAVLRFPQQTAATQLSRMANTLFPQLEITLNQVSLAAPLGLKTQAPEIRLYDAVTMVPDDLRLFIPVSAALRLKKDLVVVSSVMNGTVTGHFTGVSTSPPAFSGLEVILAGLNIGNLTAAMQQGMQATLSFDLSGRYQVSDLRENHAGSGNLVLSRVTCAIQDDFLNTMGIQTLDFDQVTMTFERHRQTIDILELNATGNIMSVTAAGQVTLTGGRVTEPAGWKFDLTGSLFPRPAHVSRFSTVLPMDSLFKTHPEKGIPFSLTGPADDLKITTVPEKNG